MYFPSLLMPLVAPLPPLYLISPIVYSVLCPWLIISSWRDALGKPFGRKSPKPGGNSDGRSAQPQRFQPSLPCHFILIIIAYFCSEPLRRWCAPLRAPVPICVDSFTPLGKIPIWKGEGKHGALGASNRGHLLALDAIIIGLLSFSEIKMALMVFLPH